MPPLFIAFFVLDAILVLVAAVVFINATPVQRWRTLPGAVVPSLVALAAVWGGMEIFRGSGDFTDLGIYILGTVFVPLTFLINMILSLRHRAKGGWRLFVQGLVVTVGVPGVVLMVTALVERLG